MPPKIATAVALTATLCITSSFAEAPEALTWDDYRLTQFIASRGRTPGGMLELDNNGEILLACRDGCTLASLDSAGIAALASQLELLHAWALLSESEGAYTAAIPILDEEDAAYMAELASGLASKIASSTADDVAALVAALEANGWREHAWAIVFSYVLDGQVWEFLGELQLVAPRTVSRRGAPWGGEAWAHIGVARPRTGTLRRGPIVAKVSWIDGLEASVESLLRGPVSIGALFDELEKGDTESAEIRGHFEEHGVLGPERQLLVPLIEQSPANELFALCERLAERVATAVTARLNRAALVTDFGFDNESQALVIVYHEIMWSLLDELVAGGVLELPAAIADPAAAQPVDIGKLVVMARGPAAAPPDPATTDSVQDEN